jgi:hypothetical protein
VSDFDPDKIRERLAQVGEEWADKDAAANLLEETKNSLLAELMNTANASSEAERKRIAQADPAFKLHLANMVTARKEANRARVRYETGKMWAELKRSQESTIREQMRIR